MKTTAELVNEIKTVPSLKDFFEDNSQEMTDPKLKACLDELLKEKSMTRAEAIRGGDLSADYAYQIFSGRKNPTRDKLIRLAVGMKLNLEETSRLFKIAGVGELYPRSRRDAVIMFCIERQVPVMNIDELLYELGMYTLA
ncbi:MAG: helix-turn-helix transcriptional regulator [Clostridiales bacterium]|nr:helix-turn-helix transcriptional regulator [Clostridiales bacterium]